MESNSLRTDWATQSIEIDKPDEALAAVPEILYVMGTGRSGTTILEVLLTNDPGIAGTGELKHIFRDGFVKDLQCACGKSGHECELWARVLTGSGWSPDDCVELGHTVERLEGHESFFRAYLGMQSTSEVARYAQANTMLFRSVARNTGSRIIVDSSKYPARALLLSRLFPGKVKVLCLTRSAEGLIAAFQKKNDAEQRPKHPFAVTAYYLYVLLCMSLVRRRLKNDCLVIRFEDMQADPAGVLAAIERWSGYSFANARRKIAAGDFLSVGHIMTGNRLRKKGKVKFDPSASKQAVAQARSSLLAATLERYRALLGF